jgi:prevent-host-death family protein
MVIHLSNKFLTKIEFMKNEIAISEFKAHCLELICKLEENKKSIIITKRNKPVAKLVPFEKEAKKTLFGALKDKASIRSDIVKSVGEKWDAEND